MYLSSLFANLLSPSFHLTTALNSPFYPLFYSACSSLSPVLSLLPYPFSLQTFSPLVDTPTHREDGGEDDDWCEIEYCMLNYPCGNNTCRVNIWHCHLVMDNKLSICGDSGEEERMERKTSVLDAVPGPESIALSTKPLPRTMFPVNPQKDHVVHKGFHPAPLLSPG